MGGHGHRNMFRLTGMPGWMRFGYSPGWGGIPPCAQYLSETGQLPQAVDWFQQQAGSGIQQPHQSQASKEQEIQMLKEQVRVLEQQIDQIRERIKQLKG